MSKKCISCGAELAEDAAFCPYCETAQEEKRPAGMPRVRRKKGLRWAAAILGLFAAVIMLNAVCGILLAHPEESAGQPAPAPRKHPAVQLRVVRGGHAA